MPPITPFLKGEEKKDLSTKAGVEIAPSSSILTPLPCGEAPDAPTSDRYTCRPAEHRRRAPARAPQARVLARTQTPAAPPRLTPRASRARTNFPVSRQRRQTVGGKDAGRHWYCPQSSDADGIPRPASGPGSKRGPSGARAARWGVRAPEDGGTAAPRPEGSPGGRAAGGPGPGPGPR